MTQPGDELTLLRTLFANEQAVNPAKTTHHNSDHENGCEQTKVVVEPRPTPPSAVSWIQPPAAEKAPVWNKRCSSSTRTSELHMLRSLYAKERNANVGSVSDVGVHGAEAQENDVCALQVQVLCKLDALEARVLGHLETRQASVLSGLSALEARAAAMSPPSSASVSTASLPSKSEGVGRVLDGVSDLEARVLKLLTTKLDGNLAKLKALSKLHDVLDSVQHQNVK